MQKKTLRVGFVSGDLCEHPVGYFIESIFSEIASAHADRLELFAYLTRDNSDRISSHIKASCNKSQFVGHLSDETLAELIYGDGIDILIDLAGHSAHNRLPVFAWRPAPVQVTWLGYFATTGLTTIDYLIADPWTLPPDQESNFSESIWRLPESRLCFTEPDILVNVNPLPAKTLGIITFGSFNNLSKISDTVIEVWASILHKVPGSRMLLKTKQLNDLAILRDTVNRFARFGIAESRLILEGHEPRAKFFAAYHKVDICLDTFPYPGGTTTVESLWMGVPVLTLAGEQFLSRQGIGLLMNAGLPDWIASHRGEYVSLAVSHAQDLEKLAKLRANLRNQVTTSPLFDSKTFAVNLELALRGMWGRWCQSQMP